jgi:hypothetical protein
MTKGLKNGLSCTCRDNNRSLTRSTPCWKGRSCFLRGLDIKAAVSSCESETRQILLLRCSSRDSECDVLSVNAWLLVYSSVTQRNTWTCRNALRINPRRFWSDIKSLLRCIAYFSIEALFQGDVQNTSSSMQPSFWETGNRIQHTFYV